APTPAPAGSAPVAVDDAATMTAGQAVSINVLSNDTDADGDLDASTVRFVDPPSGASLSSDGRTLTVPSQGTWTVNAQGVVTFTPVSGFTGTPTEVEYTVADARGNVSDSADIRISVSAAAGGGSADCYNEAMYRTGTTYAVTMRTSTGSTVTNTYTVLGTASFRGQTLPQTQVRSSEGLVSLLYSNLAQGNVQDYGGTFTMTNGETDTYHYEPVMLTPVSMTVGQTFSQTITQYNTSTGSNTPLPFTRTVKYEGRESITVPAGTFQTCRMSNSFSSNGSVTGTTSYWLVASGQYRGLAVKTISYEPNGSVSGSREATALSADWK
ncbi:MAG: Ig-like domain-containing protein, partial [Pseudomonadota bacterium]|nr:Ig-like domain-containing protein [Pseudomonadota bacterium]